MGSRPPSETWVARCLTRFVDKNFHLCTGIHQGEVQSTSVRDMSSGQVFSFTVLFIDPSVPYFLALQTLGACFHCVCSRTPYQFNVAKNWQRGNACSYKI